MIDFLTDSVVPLGTTPQIDENKKTPIQPPLTPIPVEPEPKKTTPDSVEISRFAQVKLLNHHGYSLIYMMQKTGLDEKAIRDYLGASLAPDTLLLDPKDIAQQ